MSSPQVWNHRIAALALGLGLGLSAIITPCWWSIVRDHSPSCSIYKPDFISLYSGAKLMVTDPASLYDLERQRLVQQPIDPSRGDWVLPFFYPPFFAVLLAPLAWLPFSTAFIAMTVVNLVLLIAAVKILIDKLALNRQQSNWLWLSTFCNYGVYYGLLEAQTSFLALMLLVLFVTGLLGTAPSRPGIWSGLMFFKPPLALVPLLVLLCKTKWRELLSAVLVIAFFSLVSLMVVGSEGIAGYLALSRRAAAGDEFLHIQPEGMHNLRALAYFFFATPWRDYIWWAAAVAALALIVVRGRSNDRGGTPIAAWVNILFALILVAPHLHSHDLALLVVPAALLLKWAGESVSPVVSLTIVALGMLSLINTVAYPHLPPLLPLALVIFLIVDLRHASPERRRVALGWVKRQGGE
jgi:hypothetical protein